MPETEIPFKRLTVSIDYLKAHAENYREHPEDQIEHLRASIRQYGVYRRIVVANDFTILAGHGVTEAAEKEGYEELEIYQIDRPPDHRDAKKLIVLDNETDHLAIQDDRMLTNLLRDVRDDDPTNLLGTGYDDKMLANLVYVTRPKEEIETEDAAAHWVGMPEYDQEATESPPKVVISFTSFEEAETFVEHVLGVNDKQYRKSGPNSISLRWPPDGVNRDMRSIRFEPQEA